MKKNNKNNNKKKINGKKIVAWLMVIAMVASYLSLCFMYF